MSFLQDYIAFSSGNESPDVYHKWCALSALSSLVSRRVKIDREIYTCYPNMYVLLVGNAGIKKSTAMSLAKRLLKEVGTVPIAPTAITKEALTELLGQEDSPHKLTYKTTVDGKPKTVTYTHASIFANELVTLLNCGGNATNMIEFLTDIWEMDDFQVYTKGRGKDFIVKPYLNILGCLTTETITNLLNTKIISGGFHRRCMFIYSNDYGNPIAFPSVSSTQLEAWDRCVARGKELQKIRGEFTWTDSARSFYKHWYEDILHAAKIDEPSEVRQGFMNSKGDYVLKVAMLVVLSDSNELVLTKESLELALAFIDEIEPNMGVVFEGAGRNELSPIASAIEQLVNTTEKPITVPRIHATFYNQASTSEIDDVLNHLSTTGKIKLFRVTQDQRVIALAARPDYEVAASQQEPQQ